MKKRSKQNNPEQKTRNGVNNQDMEFGSDRDLIKEAKKKYEKSGGQPVKSKFHPEPEQSR
ncbi:glycogen biosynthesis protein GlgD [Mesobacillus maritimus]|uniref:glycogen biosynthesis protein GlgD n=1 Tax=Mesobacillus maritimus TaxID=1643336 RepID=UPI00204019B9|nr:glycogen biosynthesis protein GlgD [Mesobacillus maritimus]MCM3587958.1 glycogen biosynthesis protein GlgD [Mesobacillus maritimus]MCM3670132.1 glycogen biosynthesis protein GlgD [Mesobacillus maritimus]